MQKAQIIRYAAIERCVISTLSRWRKKWVVDNYLKGNEKFFCFNLSSRLGFTEIKELDEYVGLKCLYLECNAISEISGLENQTELRCLLLHNNVIKVSRIRKLVVSFPG